MSLGLLTRASSGWRRVIGIADQGLVATSTGGSRRSGEPKRLIFKGRACTESQFLAFGSGPGSGGPKRVIFKGRVCTESSSLEFGAGPGSGGSKRFIF